MMSTREIVLREVGLRDGRQAAVHVRTGAADGRTVVFCHSAPGAGGFDPDPDATAARGATLIGVDRPGYGGSDPMPDGSWADVGTVADDVADVLEQMGTGPVGLAGWSAGGRVALAVAARHPLLVDRVVVVATPAPDDAVPWMRAEQRAALDALRDQPAEAVHEALVAELSATTPWLGPAATDDPVARGRLALLGVGDDDEFALAMPGAVDRLAAMLDVAFSQGVTGLAADLAGYSLRPWGFDPGDVHAKTLLLNGSADPIAGPRHGKWWQRNLPDARFEQIPGAGHLVVMPMWARTLAHLAPRRR
jgi:pimeloyl-ACP methyl ester carboxylesterase